MKTKNNEEGVSPVIGVMLMVAITVILAAVIASFVFGMSGSLVKSGPYLVAVNVHQIDQSTISMTYAGGLSSNKFVNGTIQVIPQNNAGTVTITPPVMSNVVGNVVTIKSSNAGFIGQTHIVVAGHFSDGTDLVIYDNTI